MTKRGEVFYRAEVKILSRAVMEGISLRYWKTGLIGILALCCACSDSQRRGDAVAGVTVSTKAIAPLSADDVSLLFPAPTRVEDFARLIAVRDLSTPNPKDSTKRDPVWPEGVFRQFRAIVASPAGQVAGTKLHIGLPPEAQSIDSWYIAGIRIDAGAPGLSEEIRAQYGTLPEIRLIVQPVTRNADGTPQVHDIAVHLVFNFIHEKPDDPLQPDCLKRPVPDFDTFDAIVADVAALRTKLSDGQLGADKVSTAGVALGVHPGLADATTASNFRQEIKAFLERHISGERLDIISIAGIPTSEPARWIFLSMAKVPAGLIPILPNGGFVPAPASSLDGMQFAEMQDQEDMGHRVVPQPHTNNLNPITCKSGAASPTSLPVNQRKGVSTSDLFVDPPPSAARVKEVLDVIIDPNKSHIFNTDCVSCHSETRLAVELLGVKDVPGMDPAVLPNDSWEVRNFGWAPGAKGVVQATVARRTAAETAADVAFINSELLPKLTAPSK